MARLDDVKKRMVEAASSMRSRAEADAAARAEVARRLAEWQERENARKQHVGDIVERAIRPAIAAAGPALGLKDVSLDDNVVGVAVQSNLSAEEAAEVISLRGVVLRFGHPVNDAASCTVLFCHRPDDAVVLFADGERVGTAHVGPLDSPARFAELTRRIEDVFGDALMKILDKSIA